jgi:hypothetical protein
MVGIINEEGIREDMEKTGHTLVSGVDLAFECKHNQPQALQFVFRTSSEVGTSRIVVRRVTG